jgi:hypothetical protein
MERLRRQPVLAILVIVVITVSVFLGLASCDDNSEEGPREVAQAFLTNLARLQYEEALDRIWTPTREELLEVSRQLQEELDISEDDAFEEVLPIYRVNSPFLLERVVLESEVPESPQHGDEVTVMLNFRDGRSGAMTLKYDEAWLVVLPLVDVTADLELDEPDEADEADEPDGEVEAEAAENLEEQEDGDE